jgi:epsilon-lactone hydrolase
VSEQLSLEARAVIAELRIIKALPRSPLGERRAAWEAAAEVTPLPAGSEWVRVAVPGPAGTIAAEWVRCGAVDSSAAVLLLHGGGYVSGNLVTHRELAARLSSYVNAPVFVVDYRRAPEHAFPAAIDDCVAAYQFLLNSGIDPVRIAVIGDSAGGGLSAALLLRQRAAGGPQPRAAVLLSPWLDLLIESPSGVNKAEADPMIVRDNLLVCAEQYMAGADPRQPLASPLLAELSGLPPLYVNVGDQEVLLDDSLLFAQKAREAGNDVTLTVGRGLWHVYPAWAGRVPEADAELRSVAQFIKKWIS